MDLTKILKVGDNVYCTLFGNVKVTKVSSTIIIESKFHKLELLSDGVYNKNGECIIFPSKENRDWSTWKSKEECPFKTFDKVLVRNTSNRYWYAEFFSNKDDNIFYCIGGNYTQCIPYNKETEHLVGTNQDCPDKYKIW